MHINQFDVMDGISKTEILSKIGVFLSERTDGCFRITLYQVENFYVEIYYHTTRFFYVCIRSFDEVSELTPYLQALDISEIYKILY